VEVKYIERQTIFVRDSKDRRHESPIVSVSAAGWAALLRGITDLA
jgi:hypothetical protein